MKIPRDLSGQHHVTIPNHDPLKIGTLSAILTDIATHFEKNRDQLLQEFFG